MYKQTHRSDDLKDYTVTGRGHSRSETPDLTLRVHTVHVFSMAAVMPGGMKEYYLGAKSLSLAKR